MKKVIIHSFKDQLLQTTDCWSETCFVHDQAKKGYDDIGGQQHTSSNTTSSLASTTSSCCRTYFVRSC